QFDIVQQADADGGYAVAHDLLDRHLQGMQRIDDRDERPVDAGGARAAIGFEHVAIDQEGSLAELVEIEDRPQATANQPLNLDRAAIDLAGLVTGIAGVGAAGQHAVLGTHPALPLADQKRRHRRLDTARTQDGRPPHAHQNAPRRLPSVTTLESQGTQFIRLSAVGTHKVFRSDRGRNDTNVLYGPQSKLTHTNPKRKRGMAFFLACLRACEAHLTYPAAPPSRCPSGS